MTLAIVMIVLSWVFAAYVFVRRQMPLASNYAIFFVFSVIYGLFPVLTFYGVEPKVWFRHLSLNESELLVSTQTLIMAACNFVFAGVYYLRHSKIAQPMLAETAVPGGYEKGIVWLGYMAACFVLVVVGFKYSYTSGLRSEMLHSAISNAKVLLAAVYIAYLVRHGFNRGTAAMLFGYTILLLVEHSRWYFLSVLVATGLYLQNTGKVKGRHVLVAALIFALLLSYVGLYRCRIEIRDIALFLNPFFIEGDYGSYVNLQTYDLIYRGRIAFITLFADYIIDPIIYLTPRVLFVGLGLDKDSMGILGLFVSTHQPCLAEAYAPIGGYHYIAQASSALPFVGPLIVTYLFAWLTIRVENSMRRSKLRELSYYLYSSGFVFVFIKTRFDLCVKYYATLAVPALIVFGLLTLNGRRRGSED